MTCFIVFLDPQFDKSLSNSIYILISIIIFITFMNYSMNQSGQKMLLQNGFTIFMSSIHFSLLPLFMVFDNNILWSPDVNYHPVKTSESLKIMNSIKDKQYAIDIDTGMTVYLYSLQDANENDIHNRLCSVNPVRHSNKEKLKIHTHNETSIKTVDKDTISYIFEDGSVNSCSVSDVYFNFIELFRGHHLTTQTAAAEFISSFGLKSENGTKIILTDSIQKNYRQIYYAFQQSIPIRMAFVDGNHRSFFMFGACMGLRNNDSNQYVESEIVKSYDIGNNYLDVNIHVTGIIDDKEDTSWDEKLGNLRNVSNKLFQRTDKKVGKDISDSIRMAAREYFGQETRLDTLSKTFVTERKPNKCLLAYNSVRVFWAKWLLSDGLPKQYFEEHSKKDKKRTIQERLTCLCDTLVTKKKQILTPTKIERVIGKGPFEDYKDGVSHRETSMLIDFMSMMCGHPDYWNDYKDFLITTNEIQCFSEEHKQRTSKGDHLIFGIDFVMHMTMCITIVSSVVLTVLNHEKTTNIILDKGWLKLHLCQGLFHQIVNILQIYGPDPIIQDDQKVNMSDKSSSFIFGYNKLSNPEEKNDQNKIYNESSNLQISYSMELFLIGYRIHAVNLLQDNKLQVKDIVSRGVSMNYTSGRFKDYDDISYFHLQGLLDPNMIVEDLFGTSTNVIGSLGFPYISKELDEDDPEPEQEHDHQEKVQEETEQEEPNKKEHSPGKTKKDDTEKPNATRLEIELDWNRTVVEEVIQLCDNLSTAWDPNVVLPDGVSYLELFSKVTSTILCACVENIGYKTVALRIMNVIDSLRHDKNDFCLFDTIGNLFPEDSEIGSYYEIFVTKQKNELEMKTKTVTKKQVLSYRDNQNRLMEEIGITPQEKTDRWLDSEYTNCYYDEPKRRKVTMELFDDYKSESDSGTKSGKGSDNESDGESNSGSDNESDEKFDDQVNESVTVTAKPAPTCGNVVSDIVTNTPPKNIVSPTQKGSTRKSERNTRKTKYYSQEYIN